jgi:hypothetical protein
VEINDSRGVLISKFEVAVHLCYVIFAIYSDVQCFEQCGKYIVVTNVLRMAGSLHYYGEKR